MNSITKHIQIPLPPDRAFDAFVHDLNAWWPREYTWSQGLLKRMTIDPREDGLCTETGPYDFRCDWGRVTHIIENQEIALKWQISPQRVPEPNPDKASDIVVRFHSHSDAATTVELGHSNFENHGDGAEAYRKAMASEQGWDYILACYAAYCEP